MFQDFNKDHQYLIKMVEGCLTGQVDKQWEHMKLGSIVQSRWTNTQSGVCRLYQSTEEPSFALQRVVNFTVFVYTPIFLKAKKLQLAEYGPSLLVEEIIAARTHCMPEELIIVQKCIQTNGFYGHPENVLFSLLHSSQDSNRKIAMDDIRRIRNLEVKTRRTKKKIRKFDVPNLNFDCQSVLDLTDLTKAQTEPPVTIGISNDELEKALETPLNL